LIKKIMPLFLLFVFVVPAPAEAQVKSCPQWEPLLKKHFPAKVVPIMSKIAYRESRCQARVISAVRKSTGRPDVGLLQIQGSWQTVTKQVCKTKNVIRSLQDPSCNVKVAGYLYRNGGLGHWRGTSGK
jgi:hypothetical protein